MNAAQLPTNMQPPSPVSSLPYLSSTKDDNLSRCYSCSGYALGECGNNGASDGEYHLPCSGSMESMDMFLNNLPDIYIPDPVYNPLPLQCLAENSLPESVRSEIDSILREFAEISSPVLLQHPESSGAASLESINEMKELANRKEESRPRSKELCKESECRNGESGTRMESSEIEQNSGDEKADIDKVQCSYI